MGRIKTTQVKRVTHELMEQYGDQFGEDFDANKAVANKYLETSSKKLRNVIAGYATRLARKQKLLA